MTEDDITRLADELAPKLVDNVRRDHHDFWIDPETHYNDHKRQQMFEDDDIYELKSLVRLFKTTKTIGFKAFIGFAIIGTIILAAFGMGFHK